MNIENDIFKRYVPDYKALIEYGFIKNNDNYKYTKIIVDNFKTIITIFN